MGSWNVTIDDTSPLFSYSPYSDGIDPYHGWSTWFAQQGYNTQNGETGTGQSLHITSLHEANVNLLFYGSDIYLYGQTNCSYDVTLDSTSYINMSARGDLLYSKTNLPTGIHMITLTARPNGTQQFGFDYAVISTATDIEATRPVGVRIDNTNSTISYSSGWTIQTSLGILSANQTGAYHETATKGANASLTFEGVAIALNGAANWGRGLYIIEVDGHQQATLNDSSLWLVPDTVLYYQGGLSPSRTHTITVTNIADEMKLSLNSFTVYQSNSKSVNVFATHYYEKHKAAIIAAPIVSTIAVLVIFGLILWVHTRRRRQDQSDIRVPGSRLGSGAAGTVSPLPTIAPFNLYPGPILISTTPTLTAQDERASQSELGTHLPQAPLSPANRSRPPVVHTDSLASVIAYADQYLPRVYFETNATAAGHQLPDIPIPVDAALPDSLLNSAPQPLRLPPSSAARRVIGESHPTPTPTYP